MNSKEKEKILISAAEKFYGQTWELIAPLNSKRIGVSCTIHKDHVYILGYGSRDIDIYHPETNSYEVMSSVLPSLKANIMMTVNGQLYIFQKTGFLRLDFDKRTIEKLADLPDYDWWSGGPVHFYNGKAYVVN